MVIARKLQRIVIPLLICGLAAFSALSYAQQESAPEIADVAVNLYNGTTEIELKSTAPFTYTIHKQTDPYEVVIDVENTSLGRFTETIFVDSAGVLEIRPVTADDAPGAARFEIALTVPADIEPIYKDNSLILAFENPDVHVRPAGEAYTLNAEAGEASAGEEQAPEESFAENTYTGEKISIDFQDVELMHVFRLIAEISGYNIVVSPDVKGRFSMKL
ncbi:MAG: AMIN domain-containing protein, partial [Nitrospiraceae bacterium]